MTVAEPTLAEAAEIMRGWLTITSSSTGCPSPEIARQCVVLSERYITDRFLPDKAIDLLDEACSDVNLRSREISQLAELKKGAGRLRAGARMLTEDTEGEHYERLAELRSRLCRVAEEIEKLDQLPPPPVTMENLARIIELWTKIPASKNQGPGI